MVFAIVLIEAIILVPTTLRHRDELRRGFVVRAEALGWHGVPRLARELAGGGPGPGTAAVIPRAEGWRTAVFDGEGTARAGDADEIAAAIGDRVRAFTARRPTEREAGEVAGQCYALLPISEGDAPFVGTLAIVKPGDALRGETVRFVLRVAGLVLIICAFTSLVVLAFLQRAVLRPIHRIVAANVATADTATPEELIPPDEIPDHEIGDIMRTRTQMLVGLRAAREEVRAKNESLAAWGRTLEARVVERTAELDRARQRAAEAEKLAAIGRLAGSVAHEVNNPMGIISASAEDLRRQVATPDGRPADPTEVARSVEIVQSQVRRVKGIIDALLRLSRQTPGQPEEIAIEPLLRETAGFVSHRADRDGQSICVVVPDPSLAVRAVRTQLQQAVVNLLENALDATPAGGTVTLGAASLGDAIALDVRDDGEGIPEAVRARIFEPFFTTKPPGRGTGMGLAIALHFVQANRGTMQCESEPGKGSTFRISLPRGPRPSGNA